MLPIVEYYFSSILFSLQVLYFLKCSLARKKLFNRKVLVSIFVVSIFYSIVFFYFEGIIKTLFLVVINIFLYIYLYKISITKSVFLSLLYMVVILLPELLILFCLLNVFGMSKEYCYEVFAGSMLGDFSIFVFFILIVFVLRKPLKKLFDTQIDTDKKLIIFIILTFLCVSLFFYTLYHI